MELHTMPVIISLFNNHIQKIIILSILLFSCDNLPYTTPQVQKRHNTIPSAYSHTENTTHVLSSKNNTITPSAELILLVPNDTDVAQFVDEIGAKLLHTLKIRKKLYVLVKGLATKEKTLHKNPNIIAFEYNTTRALHLVNDTLYASQYAPQLTNLEDVWDTYTGAGVTIAVIDTGVNTLHEDFAHADGSGTATAFATGYDVITNTQYETTDHLDNNGHGTQVAGVIAARKDNNKGIAGVAPDATIIPIKTTNNTGVITAFHIAQAITKAVELDANIINISFGGPSNSNIELEAVSSAIENNIAIIASAGNQTVRVKAYPASLPGVIAVGSSNGRDEVSSFSTRSPLLSIVAPGEDILTLFAGNINESSESYVAVNGSSMSAPFVAGTAALIKEKFPDATPAQIKQIIESTAKDLGPPGYDVNSGWGRIQPDKALETTELPDVVWTRVEFTITMDTVSLNNYPITILDELKNYSLYSIVTNAQGNASIFLKTGKYNFISNRLGIPFEGEILIGPTTTATKSRNFTSDEYDNYFRVTIFHETTKMDTYMTMLRFTTKVATLYYNPIGENDDISTDNAFSRVYVQIDAQALPDDLFVCKVSQYQYPHIETDFPSPYRIIMERGASVDPPVDAGTQENIDLTNNDDDAVNGYTADMIQQFPTLEIGESQYGLLHNADDIDYFLCNPN